MSNENRRKLLKSIAAGSGAVIVGKNLPSSWSRPVVDSVMLPAHAQTSGAVYSGSAIVVASADGGSNDSLLSGIVDATVNEATAGGPQPDVYRWYACVTIVGNAANIVVAGLNWHAWDCAAAGTENVAGMIRRGTIMLDDNGYGEGSVSASGPSDWWQNCDGSNGVPTWGPPEPQQQTRPARIVSVTDNMVVLEIAAGEGQNPIINVPRTMGGCHPEPTVFDCQLHYDGDAPGCVEA